MAPPANDSGQKGLLGASAGAVQPKSNARPSREIRILVAEDNAINQEVSLRMLQKMGFEPTIVANGQEAVEALAQTAYDIIFMDCQMPVMDGYEATGLIRKNEQPGKYPVIIAMTANALQGDREKCLEAGMDDYVSKPLKQDVLRRTLQKWVVTILQFAESGAAGEKTGSVAPQSPDAILDKARFDELAGIGVNTQPPLVERIIQRYVEDAGPRLAKMRQCVAEADFKTLGFTAHKLRGSSAQLGVVIVAKVCQQLEFQTFGDSISEAARLVDSLEQAIQEAVKELFKYLQGNKLHENPHSR
jgi:CheY-like chemotaxis protein